MGKQHAFGPRSRSVLATVDPLLQEFSEGVLDEVPFDLTILRDGGYRNRAMQEAAFRSGASKARFGESAHNRFPSQAVDLVILDAKGQPTWEKSLYLVLGAAMKRVADRMGLSGTWGGDWDRDGRSDDERFFDGPHFERNDWRNTPAVDR